VRKWSLEPITRGSTSLMFCTSRAETSRSSVEASPSEPAVISRACRHQAAAGSRVHRYDVEAVGKGEASSVLRGERQSTPQGHNAPCGQRVSLADYSASIRARSDGLMYQ